MRRRDVNNSQRILSSAILTTYSADPYFSVAFVNGYTVIKLLTCEVMYFSAT